jgi:hypothetical protein
VGPRRLLLDVRDLVHAADRLQHRAAVPVACSKARFTRGWI